MTATNHALTGAVIGLAVGNPYLALPVALISHYAMDTLPHFGKMWPLKSRKFIQYLIFEALMCFLIVLTIFLTKPHNYVVGIICAFVAASPDLLSIKLFYRSVSNKAYHPGIYNRFASRIQKKETPQNIKYDILWFIIFLFLFIILLNRS